MSLLTNIANTLGALVDDFLRSLRNGRSSDALLAETVEGMHKAFGDSYEATKDANGHILISMDSLAAAESAAKTARANVNRAVRDAQKLSGPELQIQNQQIVRLQTMATRADQVVATIKATIETAKSQQRIVEGKVAISGIDMKLKEAAAETDVAMEKLFSTMERVSDAQLRAAGYTDGANYADHSAELKKRKSRAQGRAEAAQRMVDQTIGDPFAESLSSDEMETLKAAYESAGVSMPAESAAVEQTASK